MLGRLNDWLENEKLVDTKNPWYEGKPLPPSRTRDAFDRAFGFMDTVATAPLPWWLGGPKK